MATNKNNNNQRKSKNESYSRVSVNCKESVIINGEKIDLNNLRINDSFDRNSEHYNNKRFFDEES